MADELIRLRELNDRLRLVPKGTSVDELERNASAFTHEAAKLLHGEGWRRIRKTEGKNVDGLDIDKLVNAQTFALRDLIIAAGANNATVGWLDVGTFTDTSRFVEVKPDPPKPAPVPVPEPPATPGRDDDGFYREALMQLVNERAEANVLLDRVGKECARIADVLERAYERYGL